MSTSQFTESLEYVGIDKLWVTFQINPDFSDETANLLTSMGFITSNRNYPLTWAKGTVHIGNSPVHVKIFNSGHQVQLRFNPARLMDGQGKTLCNPKICPATLFWLIRELKFAFIPLWTFNTKTAEHFDDLKDWPDDWPSNVLVQRVDIARDFYSEEESFDIQNLLPIRKKNFTRDFVYRKSGKCQTITWGSSTRARMSFYNKSDAHNLVNGWYRFEVQARTTYLRTIGIQTLADVSEESMYKELLYRWNQSCFDSVLSLGGGLEDFYKEMVEKFSPESAINFLGLATALERGIEPKVHPRTISKYQKMGNSLGFNLGADLSSLGTNKARLDIASGKLLAA
jgi:hypothetical protein